MLADQNAFSPYSISGLSNGIYYYIIVAYNELGNALLNSIKILVEIPKRNVPPQGIPDYDLFYLVGILELTYIYLIFKRFRNTKHEN